MAITNDNEPAFGLWDYHAPEHPFHGGETVEAAQGEAEALPCEDALLITRIRGLIPTSPISAHHGRVVGLITCLECRRRSRRQP